MGAGGSCGRNRRRGREGTVTHAGKVGTSWEMRCAEGVTQRVAGVKGVVMELAMAAISANIHMDADIVNSARNALGYLLPITSDQVQIEV